LQYYFEEDVEALQRSTFVTMEELIEARNGYKAFSKKCVLKNSLDLAQDEPKSTEPNSSEMKAHVWSTKNIIVGDHSRLMNVLITLIPASLIRELELSLAI